MKQSRHQNKHEQKTRCLYQNQRNPGQPRKPFCFNRKGIGTLEVVIIIAVLISVALIFRQALLSYATQLIESVFGDQSVISDLFTDHNGP